MGGQPGEQQGNDNRGMTRRRRTTMTGQWGDNDNRDEGTTTTGQWGNDGDKAGGAP